MSELDKLTEIIVTILGNDNQARNQGELLLKKLRESDFNTYIITFANLLNVSPTKQVRIFCVVHLRRLLSNFVESFESSQWYKLPNDTQKSLKQLFMEILSKEEDGVTRRLLCDLIGELYATIKKLSNEKKNQTGDEGKQWDSLMQNVWAFLTSGNTVLMESALKILGILFIYCGQEFAQHQNDLFPILKQSLEHDDLKVKSSAIEALSNYVGTVQTKHCQMFQELVPLVLNALMTILSKNEDLAVDVLSEINDMMSAEPKLFKMHFKEFLDTLKAVQQQTYTIDTIKGSALEITVMTFEMLPKMTKDIPQVIKDFFECCFAYMVSNVEDADKDWLSPPEGFVETNEDANPHDSAVKYAMHLIDRVMYKLGEEATMRTFSELLVELVKVNNWQYRYAALMGLSQTGEYITQIAELDHIVDFTLNFFKDEHPKVRYAALQCIGQFSDDSKPQFQKRYTEKVLPALVEMLADPVPRVVSHCLAALTNFLDGCEKGSVSNYILQILEPCLNFLTNAISLVKEGSMSTIATLAGACQKDFVPFWEKTAQIVFNILKDTNDKQYKQIRGQAIECLVLVGEAVGKDEFKKGSHQIIEKLIDIQKNYVDEVDPQKVYLLSGWQRICLILQDDFIPYLEHILPSLFSLVENIILGQSRRQGTTKTNETTEVMRALGGGQGENLFHKANTSESQEVSISLKMINVFVSELKKGFVPYIDKASTILTHLLQKSYNVNVKVSAARGLPGLLRVAQESAEPNKAEIIRNMSNSFIVLLWKAVSTETDAETRAIYVMMLREILRIGGRFMTDQEVVIFSDSILRSLRKSDQTRIGNEELLEDEENDIDENEEEAIRDETASEEDYHCVLAELIGTLFDTHQELTLPLARILYSKILPNVLNNKTPSKIVKFGIFVVDNMIEYLGHELLQNEWQTLGEVVIQYSIHSKAEVRHPATYGVGRLAEKTKENYQTFAEVSLKALFASLQIAKDEHEDAVEFGMSRDNAIAAIGRIIKYQPQAINFKELTQVWFKLLPLKYDRVEAKTQHDMLMDIIIHTDPSVIFGEKGENLLHAVRVFALVVGTPYSLPDFIEKMKKVIEGLVSKPETKALLQDCFGKLEPPLRDKMKNILG